MSVEYDGFDDPDQVEESLPRTDSSGRRYPLSRDEQDDVVRRRAAGETRAAIADRYGLSESGVRNIELRAAKRRVDDRRAGIAAPKPPPKPPEPKPAPPPRDPRPEPEPPEPEPDYEPGPQPRDTLQVLQELHTRVRQAREIVIDIGNRDRAVMVPAGLLVLADQLQDALDAVEDSMDALEGDSDDE